MATGLADVHWAVRASLLAAVLGFLLLMWTRRAGGGGGVFPAELGAFRDAGPLQHDAAREATADFERAFQRTLSTADAPAVRLLFAHRARAQQHLHELRMRLPNDLSAERRLAALAERLDRAMLEHIEDARQRGSVPLVHPGPVDDAWYGRWYRASNDLVQ
jgi:hypothetical protein